MRKTFYYDLDGKDFEFEINSSDIINYFVSYYAKESGTKLTDEVHKALYYTLDMLCIDDDKDLIEEHEDDMRDYFEEHARDCWEDSKCWEEDEEDWFGTKRNVIGL